MEGPRSNQSSSSTADDLELHRSSPANSLALHSSTFFESSCGSSVHNFSTSSRDQPYESFVDDPVLPWWEVEAEEILRGGDPQFIRLLCRYRIYRDSSIPASILRTSWTPALDTFLRKLSEDIHGGCGVDDLDIDQKVGLLLRLLEPLRPANRTRWHSPLSILQLNASSIASELDEQSRLLFKDIRYSDFVRETLYPEETVEPIETFRHWHDSLIYEVLDRLEHFPAEEEKFVQVQQVSTIVSILSSR